jgi:hypothetical protein
MQHERPPCPGPSREWFFCEDCWSWQLKNIGGCPCWGAKVREVTEPSPSELEAVRRMLG